MWSVTGRRLRRGGWAVLALLAVAAGAGEVPTVEGPIALGPHDQAMRVGRFWIGGMLDPEALRRARDGGVQVVINLREPDEPGWDEATAAAALGLPYHNAPVPKQAPFTRAAFAAVDAAVAAHPEAVILIHCSTGNRAAAWLATYLVASQGLGNEQALAVARRAGLSKPEAEAKVRAFLSQPPASPGGR